MVLMGRMVTSLQKLHSYIGKEPWPGLSVHVCNGVTFVTLVTFSRYRQRLPRLQLGWVIDNAAVGMENLFPVTGGLVELARNRSQRIAIADNVSP